MNSPPPEAEVLRWQYLGRNRVNRQGPVKIFIAGLLIIGVITGLLMWKS